MRGSPISTCGGVRCRLGEGTEAEDPERSLCRWGLPVGVLGAGVLGGGRAPVARARTGSRRALDEGGFRAITPQLEVVPLADGKGGLVLANALLELVDTVFHEPQLLLAQRAIGIGPASDRENAQNQRRSAAIRHPIDLA